MVFKMYNKAPPFYPTPLIPTSSLYQDKGQVEQELFGSKNELDQRITDDFLVQMAKEAKKEKEKLKSEINERREQRRELYLKNKWQQIFNFLANNYEGIDIEAEVLHPDVLAEIKRCMVISPEFLKTEPIDECKQCASRFWESHEYHKAFRDPHNKEHDFDGHFPEDHVQLKTTFKKNYNQFPNLVKNEYSSLVGTSVAGYLPYVNF